MEKEQPKIERPRYLQRITSSTDRNALVDKYLRRLVAIAKDKGYPIYNDSLLIKQQKEISARNAEIIERLNKEKGKELSIQIDAIKEELPKSMELHMPDQDEPDIWFLREPNEKVVHEIRNKIGEVVETISATPMEILGVSFFAALLSLPSPITDAKKFREALHNKYNEYIVHQNFPMDVNKPQHQFRIKLVWRV